MDNRTPGGNRRKQRAYSPEEYSPEEIDRRKKELVKLLEQIPPHIRALFRLPEPEMYKKQDD